jgi:chemotaxis signal transduction protein
VNRPAGTAPAASSEVSASLISAADEEALANRRYGVVVGGQRLLLDGSGDVRVMNPVATSPLPNTHSWFLGLANVRGTLVPVYDLAEWQALAFGDSPRMMLTVGEGEYAAATLVDVAPRYLLVPSTTCPVPTLSPGFAAHALEAYSMDDGIWTAGRPFRRAQERGRRRRMRPRR